MFVKLIGFTFTLRFSCILVCKNIASRQHIYIRYSVFRLFCLIFLKKSTLCKAVSLYEVWILYLVLTQNIFQKTNRILLKKYRFYSTLCLNLLEIPRLFSFVNFKYFTGLTFKLLICFEIWNKTIRIVFSYALIKPSC